MTISVVMPSIPPRARLMMRALASVAAQRRPADQIVVEMDREGVGAAITRHRGLLTATSDWVAFLDDDDELLPQHLERLEQHAEETGGDMVFPWFTVINGVDPFPQHFGKQWSRDAEGRGEPHQTTITFLVRREAALAVGGFLDEHAVVSDEATWAAGEDYRFVCRLNDAGYRIEHLAERTWRWHWHGRDTVAGGNTGGIPWTRQLVR